RPWNNDPAFQFDFVLGAPQKLAVSCTCFLKSREANEQALVYPTLDGSLEIDAELGRVAGNFGAQFTSASTAGAKLLRPGYHRVGVAQMSNPCGTIYANVWLRGALLC